MSHVFVSYKREDRSRVKPLVEALGVAGVPVWWDVQIEGGARWRETIKEKLDAAAGVIVVWTRSSTGGAGGFVQDEAGRADRRGLFCCRFYWTRSSRRWGSGTSRLSQ